MIVVVVRCDSNQKPEVLMDLKTEKVLQREVGMVLLELERIKLTLLNMEFDNFEITKQDE